MTSRATLPHLLPAGAVLGASIFIPSGEELGKVEDLVVDLPRGRMAYALLSFTGFLGLGGRLFAVPWAALTLHQDGRSFVVNVDREVLETAPGFDRDQRPDMEDPRWGGAIHSFYGIRPYWE
jgi:sporulation protein YlmC with PRC-barrel domain